MPTKPTAQCFNYFFPRRGVFKSGKICIIKLFTQADLYSADILQILIQVFMAMCMDLL